MTKPRWRRLLYPPFLHRYDTYKIKEDVELRGYWWERLPVLRHLLTKRAFVKSSDMRIYALLAALMDYLGVCAEGKSGEMVIEFRVKKKLKGKKKK